VRAGRQRRPESRLIEEDEPDSRRLPGDCLDPVSDRDQPSPRHEGSFVAAASRAAVFRRTARACAGTAWSKTGTGCAFVTGKRRRSSCFAPRSEGWRASFATTVKRAQRSVGYQPRLLEAAHHPNAASVHWPSQDDIRQPVRTSLLPTSASEQGGDADECMSDYVAAVPRRRGGASAIAMSRMRRHCRPGQHSAPVGPRRREGAGR
jgi:hypothetical protein